MKNSLRVLLGIVLCLMVLPMISKAAETSLPKIANLSEVDTVSSADFTSDDVFFATGDNYNNIAVWKTSDGTLVNKWENSNNNAKITKLFYGPTDDVIYTANSAGVVQSWDITNNTNKTFVKDSYYSEIWDLALNDDGSLLYVANSNGNQVMFLDAITGNEKKVLKLTSEPLKLAYNKKLNHLAIGLYDGTIAIHDAITGDYIQTIVQNDAYKSINLLAYSKDDTYLYGTSSEGAYQLTQYNATQNYEKMMLEENDFKTTRSSSSYKDMSISEDNRFLALSMSNDYGLKIFDTHSKQQISTGDVYSPSAVAFSHNGERIVAGNTLLNSSSLPKRELSGVSAVSTSNLVLPNTEQPLRIDALYNDGTRKELKTTDVTISSSNPKVAKFQYGKLFALTEGKTTITVAYKNYTMSFEVVVTNIIELAPEQGVSKDKTWTIKLNKNVSVDTVREKNVYVEDSKGNIVPMLYYVEQSNLKQIKLMPVKDYVSGETYTMWIKDLQSTTGQTVKYTKKIFTVK